MHKKVHLFAPIGRLRRAFLIRFLRWKPRDAVAFILAAFATVAILVNGLFMQSGAHPAPMFKPAGLATKPKVVNESIAAAIPPSRRADPVPAPALGTGKIAAPAALRTPGEIINDIQRELSRRGYYEGPVDGFYGPKTDAAIREFENAAGLKPSTEPNEALLQAIMRSPSKAAKTATNPVLRPTSIRNDSVGERMTPSPRIIALQRALAEYGYGQIKPSGILDGDTQRAIEKFERERKLPITGQISDRVMREVSAMTGRPLE